MTRRHVLLLFFLCVAFSLQAKTKKVTLHSENQDRVILEYDVSFVSNQYVLCFKDVRKTLGKKFGEQYKLSDVQVLFFDREGNYQDIKFSGKTIEAFTKPFSVSYKPSDDGFFFLADNPELTFNSTEAFKLSIPIYLVHYDKKRHYNVFASCGPLEVDFSSKEIVGSTDSGKETSEVTIVSQEEESAITDAQLVDIYIRNVNELLADQDELPFSDDLKEALSRLRELRERSAVISDKRLDDRISEVLDECKKKEKELKERGRAAAEAEKQKVERERQQAQAHEDSIRAMELQKAEEQKKQNIWLAVGGVLLAVLIFVGNQIFQHFRNLKNQKSILDMQQSVVKRAEDEAKRRARNAAQSKVNQAKTEARKKTRDFVDGTIGKMGKDKKKGTKNYSI